MDHKSLKRWSATTAKVILLFLVLLPARLAFSQAGSSARLTGQVLDSTGAAMTKVDIEVEEITTGVRRTTVSNDAGYFSIDVLPPGTYKLTAKAPGFSATQISPIALSVNQTANLTVSKKPGEVNQQITIDASVVALETQTSSLRSEERRGGKDGRCRWDR